MAPEKPTTKAVAKIASSSNYIHSLSFSKSSNFISGLENIRSAPDNPTGGHLS